MALTMDLDQKQGRIYIIPEGASSEADIISITYNRRYRKVSIQAPPSMRILQERHIRKDGGIENTLKKLAAK